MNQQLLDWAKEALETLEDNHDLVADNEKHRYVMMHLDVIKRGKALLEQPEPVFCEYCGGNDDVDFGLPTDHCTDCDRPQPAQPDGDKLSPTDAQPSTDHSEQHLDMVDHADELTIAYLGGLHTGKKIAKREWVGLTDDEFNELYDAYEKSNGIGALMQRVEAKLKEKNT